MDIMEAARWLRREHEKVDKLIGELDLATRQPRGEPEGWLDTLRSLFADFRTSLLRHFELEEVNGYLATVLARRPTLHRQVERLKDEHHQFAVLLEHPQRALEVITPVDPVLIGDCCKRIQGFLADARDHEQRENSMVADVYNIDIGISD